MNENITDWAKGDTLSAGHWNQPLPTVRSVQTIRGSGVDVLQSTNGTTITLPNSAAMSNVYLVAIVAKGPNNEDDFTDHRYWLRLQVIAPSGYTESLATGNSTAPTGVGADDPNNYTPNAPAFQTIVPGTNIGEPAASHSLLTDGTVLAYARLERDGGTLSDGSDASDHYVIEVGNSITPTGNITGTLTGGRYTLNLFTGSPSGNMSGNLTLPDPGETVGNVTVAWENVAEDGLGTNWCGNGTKVSAFPTGGTLVMGNTTYPIYRGISYNGKTASPTTLSGNGTTADTGNWSRSGNGTPLDLTIHRTAWDGSGNGTLLGFSRVLSFDAAGLIIGATVETQYTINAAGNCTT